MESLIVGNWTASPEVVNTTSAKDPDKWLVDWARGGTSDAGIAVNAETSLSHTPIWHGLLLLGGDAGSLVMQLKRLNAAGKSDDRTHTAYKLTSVRPNSHMVPNTFFELLITTAILHGNFVGEIVRAAGGGRPLSVSEGGGILPLNPRTTKPSYDDTGRLWISTRDLIDGRLQPERFLEPADTLHISNLTTNGFWGRAITDVGKNRIANGLGYLSHSNHVFANATKPDFLYSFPGPVQQAAIDNFREELDTKNAGLHNRGKPIIVGSGMTATQLGMNLEDAQLVELVQLDVTQCASLLGIPAIMLMLPAFSTITCLQNYLILTHGPTGLIVDKKDRIELHLGGHISLSPAIAIVVRGQYVATFTDRHQTLVGFNNVQQQRITR